MIFLARVEVEVLEKRCFYEVDGGLSGIDEDAIKIVGYETKLAIFGTTQNIVRCLPLPPISARALNFFSNKLFFALMINVASSYETSPLLVCHFLRQISFNFKKLEVFSRNIFVM